MDYPTKSRTLGIMMYLSRLEYSLQKYPDSLPSLWRKILFMPGTLRMFYQYQTCQPVTFCLRY